MFQTQLRRGKMLKCFGTFIPVTSQFGCSCQRTGVGNDFSRCFKAECRDYRRRDIPSCELDAFIMRAMEKRSPCPIRIPSACRFS